MDARSLLTEQQRTTAVALFESGWGDLRIARELGASRSSIRRLYDRWLIRGAGALVDNRPTRRSYTFETKSEVVQRALDGESKHDLAREFGLSSPKQVEAWLRRYRHDGEDGLRPKQVGRPAKPAGDPPTELDELERLRRENEILRAQVAVLGKVRALKAPRRS